MRGLIWYVTADARVGEIVTRVIRNCRRLKVVGAVECTSVRDAPFCIPASGKHTAEILDRVHCHLHYAIKMHPCRLSAHLGLPRPARRRLAVQKRAQQI